LLMQAIKPFFTACEPLANHNKSHITPDQTPSYFDLTNNHGRAAQLVLDYQLYLRASKR